MALHVALDRGAIRGSHRASIIQQGLRHPDLQIRDLFEGFVSAEARSQRLGGSIHPGDILQLSGDADRGRRLFLETAGVNCKNCHTYAGQGTAVGPDLTGIGQRWSRAQLLESILEPSRTIDPKFLTYVVETADGQVHTGLLRSRGDQWVVLQDAEGKERRIPAGDVELLTPQQKSLMPELLLQDFSPQQVADLLAFLAGGS
jgi:putative heme-binding domain-containing protein